MQLLHSITQEQVGHVAGPSRDAGPSQIIKEGPQRDELGPGLQDGLCIHSELRHYVGSSGCRRHISLRETVDIIISAGGELLKPDQAADISEKNGEVCGPLS